MNRPSVEVVVINYRRPDNVARIVDALRGQSVPCTITLCDGHPSEEFALTEETLAKVDRIYLWEHNYGAYNRYVPLGGYDHEFTLFLDDDLLPGSRCIEHFLSHADRRFGVLGQLGRRLPSDGIYQARDVRRTQRFEEVDLVVQAYFVRTEHLGNVVTARWLLGQQTEERAEDDIILAVGMQLAGLGCYLTPHSDDPETSVMREKLPSPHALSHRKDHFQRRTALFAAATKIGWRPWGARRYTPLVWAIRGAMRRSRYADVKTLKKSSP